MLGAGGTSDLVTQVKSGAGIFGGLASVETGRGFEAGEVEPDGHIAIRGAREKFEQFADYWSDVAELVPISLD